MLVAVHHHWIFDAHLPTRVSGRMVADLGVALARLHGLRMSTRFSQPVGMWEIPTEAELDAVVELDWDVAGPWSAAEELAATVAEWTEILEDQPRKEFAADLLRGYAAAGGTLPTPEPGLFTTWLVKQVNWTMLLPAGHSTPPVPRRNRPMTSTT
ncbi:hypothetical protein ACIBVK_28600 [Micromonospora echinofusca]|uniref:hypothetical protein n=2 Tax=Micromonospora echinofusca TaxID=47858 RepID=UPI000C714EC7|nr:hypothetical protein [Micromonospora sp. MSM11]MCL7456263.1 hypothetical protein [Micromonospora sp. MSM11]